MDRLQNLFRSFLQHMQCYILLMLLSAAISTQAIAQNPSLPEYKLKVALIYKLTKFITWPEELLNQQGFFGICVLGETNFGKLLKALEQRSVAGQPIRVFQYEQSDEIKSSCSILYISESKQGFVSSIFHNIKDKSILTLADFDRFAELGGIIEFTSRGNKIGFKINQQEAERHQIRISAPLLQLATIVEKEAE